MNNDEELDEEERERLYEFFCEAERILDEHKVAYNEFLNDVYNVAINACYNYFFTDLEPDEYVPPREEFLAKSKGDLELCAFRININFFGVIHHYSEGKEGNYLKFDDISAPPYDEEKPEDNIYDYHEYFTIELSEEQQELFQKRKHENDVQYNIDIRSRNKYRKDVTDGLKKIISECLLEFDDLPPRAYLELEYLAWEAYTDLDYYLDLWVYKLRKEHEELLKNQIQTSC